MRITGRVVLCAILLIQLNAVNGQTRNKKGEKLLPAASLRGEHLELLTQNVFSLSEVMLHDVANPPAAARFYSYALLGAYEAILFASGNVPDINSRLRENPISAAPVPPTNPDLSFCATYTLLQVGKQIMPSGPMLEEKQKSVRTTFRKKYKMPGASMEDHIRYCEEIAAQIIQYAKQDGYGKLSTYKRYTPSKEDGRWYPTPPEYMAAIEPEWRTIRPFFLDSATQFKPFPAAPFSKDTASSFYKQMREVYSIGKTLTKEQRDIANFWDCNPFAVTYSGHMAIGLKKISPGGHWMGIAGIACRKANISIDSAVLVHTMVAMTLHDTFISCWQAKYKTDRIRPETAINRMVDPSWRPILQTPPFPEYTSGHSIASASASVILTYMLGDNFAFTDTSEEYFGIPARDFTSFYQAANEAAISRLYGGIHFRDACESGTQQGLGIGKFVVGRAFNPTVQ